MDFQVESPHGSSNLVQLRHRLAHDWADLVGRIALSWLGVRTKWRGQRFHLYAAH